MYQDIIIVILVILIFMSALCQEKNTTDTMEPAPAQLTRTRAIEPSGRHRESDNYMDWIGKTHPGISNNAIGKNSLTSNQLSEILAGQ